MRNGAAPYRTHDGVVEQPRVGYKYDIDRCCRYERLLAGCSAMVALGNLYKKILAGIIPVYPLGEEDVERNVLLV